ncbi:MAG: DUF4436 family protein [Candidatus Eremiobacteraeota bacterium]|nr:DUF4436 family protein [Candidatus Eremiobacteraeota bacterium]
MSAPKRWLLLSILFLLAGGAGLLYASVVQKLTNEPLEPNLVVDINRKEVRTQTQVAHLVGSPFYYPRDRYSAVLQTPGNFQASGFKVQSNGNVIEIERSALVQFSAHTIVALIWITALSVAAAALKTLIAESKPDPALLTWASIALLALPALRQTMVGAPAIGIYIDFYGFLCCEVIVVVSLLALTVKWLARKD